ncbi:hypothetical protein E2562_019034 [Oryza meyeriana var. granulata]|uniref:Uncharacterized protein n=1 Tax=Oryza meyeriana var. granulata TaxID=110450 RepID=A0A6G1EMW4_9ORYZ|nr:hypothetical protein E2562_019034 [Oryza meyeriana var. granulata]
MPPLAPLGPPPRSRAATPPAVAQVRRHRPPSRLQTSTAQALTRATTSPPRPSTAQPRHHPAISYAGLPFSRLPTTPHHRHPSSAATLVPGHCAATPAPSVTL